MNVDILAAYVSLDLLTAEEIIEGALVILEEGSESMQIAYLASEVGYLEGESRLSYEDAKNEFLLFLKEEKISVPDTYNAKKTVIADICNKIVSGELSPQEGLHYIISKIQDRDLDDEEWGEYLSIEDLIGYYYTIDHIESDCPSLSSAEKEQYVKECEQAIIDFCKDYLAKRKGIK